uniref:Voltage-gated potassium channel Kch n=1 Tax=Lygus hesperus TaxID=30085 RepID=A0A0A9W4P6_LYGHE
MRQYFLLLVDSVAVMIKRNRKLDLFRLAAGPLTLFLALLFTAAGCFRIDQAFQHHPMNIAVSIYFLVVTVTTVGFGDVVPLTQEGKVIVIIIIFVFITQMPTFIYAIRSSIHIFQAFRSYSGRRKHFIIYGRVERHEVMSILDEIFALYPMKSVCFCNKEFSDEVVALGRHPRYRLRADFLKCDNLDAFALRRLKVDEASSVIILPS